MFKPSFFFLFITLLQFSCSNNQKEDSKRPDTALEIGTLFIQNSLQGNFDKCTPLLLLEHDNSRLFEKYKAYYSKKPDDWKKKITSSGYIINKYLDVNDSTTIINYSSPALSQPMEIKVILRDHKWWVDYQYTYSGNLPID